MVVIFLGNQIMSNQLVKDLEILISDVEFKQGESFYWSPEQKVITYNEDNLKHANGQWALFHEAAHAKLGHISYSSDLGLLKLEVEAWDEAKILATKFKIKIDENHIQDCLDTYRDWLHQRSTCPTCEIVCLQATPTHYKCHNCFTTWSVTASRFCRAYRLLNKNQEKRLQSKIATFS